VESDPTARVDLDLGNAVILPGLVNAHTHLDLGGLRALPSHLKPPVDFVAWLRAVVAYRRSSTTQEWDEAIVQGIKESLRCGTTLIGDISADGRTLNFLSNSPLRATVFHEVIGLTRARARQTWQAAARWIEANPATAVSRPGLSPHAPYSVRKGLFRLAARWSRRLGLPLCSHLAETHTELELLSKHEGALRQFLEELGAWDESGLAPSIDWIAQTCGQGTRFSGVHLNHAAQAPMEHLIWCPRTHAYFGHPPHPFEGYLKAGVNVALGTDSLASNPDLSMLEEARWVHRSYPQLGAAQVLRLVTINGAKALMWEEEVGSLSPGKSADWIAIPLEARFHDQPELGVLESDSRVWMVCIRGAVCQDAEA
jgi:cytosine/adenosine deaminase-related metal-dependent hydrolase